MQEQFIKYLKAKSKDNTSFIEEVAFVLDIGYDAAYRRVNLKTNLSLEESVILARHYNVSLNKLYEVGNKNSIVVDLSPPFQNVEGLELYFRESHKNIESLVKLKSASISYSAKDIPFFHTLKDTYLTHYKIYVWLKDVNTDMAKSKISFEEFRKSIPDSLLESVYTLGDIYNYISITELWNDYTIIGTLQQVLYYYESRLLTKESALLICNDIEKVINQTEKQTIMQSLVGSDGAAQYNLYKTDLHTLNNTIMVQTAQQRIFFQPFTVLTYFKIEHKATCDLMYGFFEKQKMNSKLLVNSGEKDRTLFFLKMHQKINRLRMRIEIEEPFVFD